MEINEESMACLVCGHIAKPEDDYLTEGEYPICPNCGEWNIGGYQSFAPWGIWPNDEKMIIRGKKQLIK